VNFPWLILGALAGYVLIMRVNPIRASLRDGLRALRRYPALWLTLGAFGFGYAIFDLALRFYFSHALPPGMAPIFVWARAPFRAEWSWVSGTRDSLWSLPDGAAKAALHAALLPTLDGTAGLFNNLVSTFPLSALAALGLLLNLNGRQGVLFRALRRRFGRWGPAVHGAILLCALAAAVKPGLFVVIRYVPEQWLLQWSQVVVWLAFLFEYLFGIYVQVYLILLAYCWVRGLTFDRHHLVDFAIRRSSFVLRWAAVVMILSSLCIDLPLILKNFAPYASWMAQHQDAMNRGLVIAREALDGILLCFASVQITLTFHSESLRKALRNHLRFLGRNAWPLGWFLLLAASHFYLLQSADILCRGGLGEGTALWVSWKLLFPWLSGAVGAWLLASWVCVFRRCDTGRVQGENWIQF
jgi:hypothetical protein